MTRAITLTPAEAQAAQAGTLKEIRRAVKPQPDLIMTIPRFEGSHWVHISGGVFAPWPECTREDFTGGQVIAPPYQTGTELWGRESYWLVERDGMGVGNRFVVFSDEWQAGKVSGDAPLRPIEYGRFGAYSPATMPRWASRWAGVVDAVRIERDGDVWVWVAAVKGEKV